MFVSAKGDSAQEQVTPKGGKQAYQRVYLIVRIPYQQDVGVPQEVPSLWSRTTPTGRQDP